jgi:putative hydrolase of the HAD superfamily
LIDTILFDNWNTLVQAPGLMKGGASVEIFQRSLREQGFYPDPGAFSEVYRPIARKQVKESESAGWTEIDYIQRIMLTLEGLGVKEPRRSRLAIRAWDDYLAEWPKQTSFFPETPALLENLQGKYRLGVVTNFMDGPTARRIFDDMGYEALFDSLVVSAEIGYQKPATLLFTRALEELGSKSENTIMVGDTYEADVIGAHNSGIRGVRVDSYWATNEQIGGSYAVIKNIGDLPRALDALG